LWPTDIPHYLFVVANGYTTLSLRCGQRIYHIISSLWPTDIPHYLFVVANGYHIISSLWRTDIPHYLFVVANGYHIISSLWQTDTNHNTQNIDSNTTIKVYHKIHTNKSFKNNCIFPNVCNLEPILLIFPNLYAH
jgi:hypothetical protein